MSLDLRAELSRIAAALAAAGIDYALCGGLAVAVHGYPRATRDLDFLVREDDLAPIVSILQDLGFTLPAGIIPFDVGKETERRIYRVSKAEGENLLTLDLILVTPVLKEVWSGRETYEVGGQELQVVSREGLAKMKRAAGRPQDVADLKQLGLDEKP